MVAIVCFLAVYVLSWLAGCSPESITLKGLAALAAVGAVGWVLKLIVVQESPRRVVEKQKGETIDITLE